MITRRQFGVSALFGLIAGGARAQQAGGAPNGAEGAAPQAEHDMTSMPPEWLGAEQIVFVGYPMMTALDLIGPQYMFANLWGASVKIAAKTMAPLKTDTGVTILPDMTFAEAPEAPDVICVPGGTQGTFDAIEDAETLAFVRSRGQRARYVTSVCTGSLLLGAAGLLKGYRASSHWVSRPLLTEFGAIPVDERIVRDRNRVTGAGVTAGIDFGLAMLAEMRDPDYAMATQLLAEYDPQPPFDAGTPDKAPAHVTQMMRAMFVNYADRAKAAFARATRF